MLAPSRSKAVAKSEKVLLVDRVDHLAHCSLHDLVFNRRDSQCPLASIRFLDEHSPAWLRPVPSSVNPPMQLSDVLLQLLPVFTPRHSIDTSCRSLPELPVCVRQPLDAHVVEQRREPHLPVPSRYLTHPIERICHVLPALRPAHVALHRVPLGCRPSLHSVRSPFRFRSSFLVPALRRYYDGM